MCTSRPPSLPTPTVSNVERVLTPVISLVGYQKAPPKEKLCACAPSKRADARRLKGSLHRSESMRRSEFAFSHTASPGGMKIIHGAISLAPLVL